MGKGVERLRRYRDMGSYGQFRYDELERQALLEGRYIPLQGFDHVVRSRARQRELARFVPGLAGLDVDPAASAVAALALHRMNHPAFWTLIALSPGVTIVLVVQPPATQAWALRPTAASMSYQNSQPFRAATRRLRSAVNLPSL